MGGPWDVALLLLSDCCCAILRIFAAESPLKTNVLTSSTGRRDGLRLANETHATAEYGGPSVAVMLYTPSAMPVIGSSTPACHRRLHFKKACGDCIDRFVMCVCRMHIKSEEVFVQEKARTYDPRFENMVH